MGINKIFYYHALPGLCQNVKIHCVVSFTLFLIIAHSTVLLIQRSDEDIWKNEDMLALDVRNLINDVSAQLNLKQKCSDGHCATKHW